MLPYAPILDDQVRPLRRREYERLVELGAFEGERVELLYGRIVEMAPRGPDHAGAIQALTRLLVSRLTDRADVRVQLPFVAPDDSEPEPDIAVVPSGHPDQAFLLTSSRS